MKKALITLITIIFIAGSAYAVDSSTRLYVGEFDGRPMAGIDSIVKAGSLYVGADIRTIIKDAINDPDKYAVIGFAPDRTDYTFKLGFDLGLIGIEYASTCYHRVISSTELTQYLATKAIPNTQTLTVTISF